MSVSCQDGTDRDYSLSIEEFQNMGMPDPNRIWDSEDIGKAIDVCYSIKWDQPYSLPKKESRKTGILFDRMISLENMSFLHDDALHLSDKAYASLHFLEIFEQWKDVYTHPMWKKQYYHRELVDININEVRVTEIMVELTKKVLVSNDPKIILLQSGVPQVRMNYVSSLLNAMNLQSFTSQFLQKDLELMSDSLSASVLRNKAWMNSAQVDQIKNSIQVVLDSTSSAHITEKYSMLTSHLQ